MLKTHDRAPLNSDLCAQPLSPGGGGTPYNGLYGEAPVYKRVGIPRAEVYERVGKSVI